MPTLQLTDQEGSTLHCVLTQYVSDLRFEISNTDSYDFRQDLKHTEALLKRLISDLEAITA